MIPIFWRDDFDGPCFLGSSFFLFLIIIVKILLDSRNRGFGIGQRSTRVRVCSGDIMSMEYYIELNKVHLWFDEIKNWERKEKEFSRILILLIHLSLNCEIYFPNEMCIIWFVRNGFYDSWISPRRWRDGAANDVDFFWETRFQIDLQKLLLSSMIITLQNILKKRYSKIFKTNLSLEKRISMLI